MPVKTITFDFWGTLLFDGPGSDDRYKNRRLSEFETLLGSAGISVTAAALDRAYDESGTYLARIWSASVVASLHPCALRRACRVAFRRRS